MRDPMKFRFGIRQKAFFVLIAVLALGSLPCPGARPYQPVNGDPMLEPWRWRTFPELSGLGARCMAEGTNGTIWFGLNEGVWCYDGLQWSFSAKVDQGTTLYFTLPKHQLTP